MTGSAEWDYIVVGGGTAGCVLAARLSEDPGVRVLLLEAGAAALTSAMTVPASWPELLGTQASWADMTVPQAEAGPVPYPRGRVLGGSGSVNAMAHIRGHHSVYDQWPAGWKYQDLLPFFRRSEHATGPGRSLTLRGTSGPVHVAPVPAGDRHHVAVAFGQALAGIGCPVTDDLSGSRQEGVCWLDLAIHRGRRVSPAGAYLEPAGHRANLTIQAGSLATRLIISDGRCSGVVCRRDGTETTIRTRREVIVCAGAIGSPKLLLLSGIGPARDLQPLGITPVADLPAVGRHLADHPVVTITYAAPAPFPCSGYNHGEVYAALRSAAAGRWPDLQLFPILLPIAPAGMRPPEAGYALAASAVAPASRGQVRLASADPLAPPLIDPAFLRSGTDLDRLEAGLELIRRAAATPSLAGCGTEVYPGPGIAGSTRLRGYIRRAVGSYYHPAGTCRLGDRDDSVTDTGLRVRGITGLRIADASVIPLIPNAPLHATVLAIAEKAATLITT